MTHGDRRLDGPGRPVHLLQHEGGHHSGQAETDCWALFLNFGIISDLLTKNKIQSS